MGVSMLCVCVCVDGLNGVGKRKGRREKGEGRREKGEETYAR